MLKIGLTGGIGSGKTVVSEIFQMFHIPVYNADEQAKYLNDHSESIRSALTEKFGNNIYQGNKLNRPLFAQLIFSNPENVAIANNIIHPVLMQDFERWLNTLNSKIAVMEAAILLEANLASHFDKIIVVQSPKDLRIKRATLRDNIESGKIEQRIENQWDDAKRNAFADFVIFNDNQNSLIRQVSKILDELRG